MENFNSKKFHREIHSLYLPGRRTVLPLLVFVGKDTFFKSCFAFMSLIAIYPLNLHEIIRYVLPLNSNRSVAVDSQASLISWTWPWHSLGCLLAYFWHTSQLPITFSISLEIPTQKNVDLALSWVLVTPMWDLCSTWSTLDLSALGTMSLWPLNSRP